jgi:hypothetical protein
MTFTQGSFPPAAPSVLGAIIPAYAYAQYQDDDSIQAFFSSYNDAQQYYLDWFVNVGLPVYTGLSSSLLDWVAQGLYGLTRPVISSEGSGATGPLGGIVLGGIVLAGGTPQINPYYVLASDDVFKRIMTWDLYRGDGRMFTLKWLKRRVLRFLLGFNGTDVNLGDTSELSIQISGDTVTINLTALTSVSLFLRQTFLYCVEGALIDLPPQYIFEVVV